ncbi:hypothetical protein VZO05_07000 [Aggregatilineales bacterium SYSU G02658]
MESAILRTVLYADIFDYPLTAEEIYLYLIGRAAESPLEVERLLRSSDRLRELLCQQQGFVFLRTRPELVERRQAREAHAAPLLESAQRYGHWLAQIPFVRMVAVTGAVAMRNPSHANDDIDYMLIVQPGRVWLARALAVLLVRFTRLRGVELCPNYVLAADKLTQTRTDLYVAHELTQMRPVYGYAYYCALLNANGWAWEMLPNSSAHPPLTSETQPPIKQALEYLLRGRIGSLLDGLEYRRRAAHFQKRIHSDAAVISPHAVKGHFHDHGQRILEAYYERLERYDVTPY